MIKRLIIIFLLFVIATPQVFANDLKRVNENISARKPKPCFWRRNKINLFYQKKHYKGLSDKYKNFSIGVMEVKDERMSKFYHRKDKFFQTKLLPTLQLLMQEELKHSGMFKDAKIIYEPFIGEMTPGKMDRIKERYNVDMVLLVNLTDFQMIRGMSKLHSKMMLEGNNVIPPDSLDGMDLNFRMGGIFQAVFLPAHHVVWSDTLERQYLKFAPKGKLKSKEEMEPIVQNLLGQVMTDMLYLMSEDGKRIQTRL